MSQSTDTAFPQLGLFPYVKNQLIGQSMNIGWCGKLMWYKKLSRLKSAAKVHHESLNQKLIISTSVFEIILISSCDSVSDIWMFDDRLIFLMHSTPEPGDYVNHLDWRIAVSEWSVQSHVENDCERHPWLRLACLVDSGACVIAFSLSYQPTM